jgi:Na+/glutamate symporter
MGITLLIPNPVLTGRTWLAVAPAEKVLETLSRFKCGLATMSKSELMNFFIASLNATAKLMALSSASSSPEQINFASF